MFLHFATKHACVRRTDRQNYDPQDRANIAASRGKIHIAYYYILVRDYYIHACEIQTLYVWLCYRCPGEVQQEPV